MHVEPLEKLPRSVREFLSHYAMIVLSILTALALEQVALGFEHRHEGHRAKEEIDQEIASNRHAVEDSLKATHENAEAWSALLHQTVDEVRDGTSTNDTRVATMKAATRQFRDALPSLKTTAWDAAIADHSVNYIDHEVLTRYSELYASQRMFSQAMWDTLRDGGVHNMSDIALAVYVNKADATPMIATLNNRMLTIRIIESQLAQLDAGLKEAAGERSPASVEKAAPASAAAASAAVSASSH